MIKIDNQAKIRQHYDRLDRSLFMNTNKQFAKIDMPFPIGYGQTISQPSLVLDMTLLLNPNKQEKVLEIGTGSGYQTALLSMASQTVYTVEIIEELHFSARKLLNELGFTNIKFKRGDGHNGWKEYAPFDKIMVTAAAENIPKKLIYQLANNGMMVITVKADVAQDLLLIKKADNGTITKEFISKVKFVDLVKEKL